MAKTIIMPKQGLQMTEGTITEWLKKEGDAVAEGEPLFSMETDKLTITIDSTASGTLLKILRQPNDVVPITQPIAIVGEPGEDISALSAGTPAAAPVAEEKPVAAAATTAAPAPTRAPGERIFVSPRAKKLAAEKGIDLANLTGTGPEGMIVEADVQNAPVAPAAPAASPLARKLAAQEGVAVADVSGTGSHGKVMAGDIRAAVAARAKPGVVRGERKVPLTGMRKVVANRMHESLHTMAQANHRMSVDMSEAVRMREQYKANGMKVSYNDIILRCVARALADTPYMNVSFYDDGIVFKDYVNLGMAVALEGGLIVPVIKDADLMNIGEISASSRDLAERAKTNQLQPDEYTGGTFTVSNLGMFDVDDFTPIINPPEAGIIGVGKMEKKIVVLPDESTAIRPMMQLSLTYDHRAVDGATAAQFLQRVKKLLEAPYLMV